jgi:peptide/nickel transport system ATP-binding protein
VKDNAMLRVSGLTVAYAGAAADNVVVRGVDLAIEPGKIAGLAGESGSGKSTLALAAIGYTAPAARILTGTVTFGDRELYALSGSERRRIWGSEIGFVAQSAFDALNPSIRIGRQLDEVIRVHDGGRGATRRSRQLELLERVGIPDPSAAIRRYPHEFSGGQLQRIAIAAAVACRPRILILDEPTTGLDVQTQRQISQLLLELVTDHGIGALYVSHDLALLSSVSDRVHVMYAGEIVESGATDAVLRQPSHPYTRALLDAVPSVTVPRMLIGIPGRPPNSAGVSGCSFAARCRFAQEECTRERVELISLRDERATRCVRHHELELAPTVLPLTGSPNGGRHESPLLEVSNVCVRYRRANRDAVTGLSLQLRPGEAVGLVGESGSGKSTVLRAIAGLVSPTTGEVRLHGRPLGTTVGRREREAKRAIQLVFQNPDSSLNPAHTVAGIISRPLRLFGSSRAGLEEDRAIAGLLDKVGLGDEVASRHPDELSGGQKQRVAIARAFAAEPEVLLCDEITSALDVSVQATIVTLLGELAAAEGVAILFVTHDLGVVRAVASRIVVMKDGSVAEEGEATAVFEQPAAAYTKALLAAIPSIEHSSLAVSAQGVR